MESLPAVRSLVALSLACLLSAPAALAAARRLTGRRTRHLRPAPEEESQRGISATPGSSIKAHGPYHDEDGAASHESSQRFSDKWQRTAVLLSSLAGLGASTALLLAAPPGQIASAATQSGIWVSEDARGSYTPPPALRRGDAYTYSSPRLLLPCNLRYSYPLSSPPRPTVSD